MDKFSRFVDPRLYNDANKMERKERAPRATGTSTILVPTGDQDPTVHLTQSLLMAVAPPILEANQI